MFAGAGVLRGRGGSRRQRVPGSLYTVKLAASVYVLHALSEEIDAGMATPQHELELIKQRLKARTAKGARAMTDITERRGSGAHGHVAARRVAELIAEEAVDPGRRAATPLAGQQSCPSATGAAFLFSGDLKT